MTRSRILFLAALILLACFVPRWMPPQDPKQVAEPGLLLKSLRELRSSRASDAKKSEALARVLREADRRKDALSSDQMRMIEELRAARADEERNKVSGRLANSLEIAEAKTLSFSEWAADMWSWAHDTYRLHQAQAQWSLWLIAVLLVVAGFAGILLSLPHYARVAARLGFRLSRVWLVVLSFVAIVVVMVTRMNPWSGFPTELLLAPFVALIGCGLALRVVDFNYPVWNSLVRGCGAPLVSMAFTAVYLRLI